MQGDFAICRRVSRSVRVTSQPGPAGLDHERIHAGQVAALPCRRRHVSLSKVSLVWTDSLCGREWKGGDNSGKSRRVGLSAGILCSIVDVKVVGSLLLDIVSRADGRGGGGRRQDRGEEPSREHEVSPPEPDAGVAPHA